MLKKSTFLQGHQNGHPARVLQGHVTASKLVPFLRHVTNLWVGHVSASLRLIFGLSFYVFGALALDLPCYGGTLKLGKYYIQYSFRVWCYLNALSVAFIEIWRNCVPLHRGLCCYAPISVKSEGGGVRHRVGLLIFSEKKLSKSPPRAKNNCQKYQNPPPWGKGRRSYTLQSLLHARRKQ